MCYLQIIIIIIIIIVIIVILLYYDYFIILFLLLCREVSGFFSFLGFIRMYTTISHPLDRSFFRIWKEAFETH